jgi:flagellar hook-associated protein 1 FlgK
MPSLSSGIILASQAVQAQSQVLETIEHNVANANTPGYRRQSAILTASVPSSVNGSEYGTGAGGQRGGGVSVERIQRFNLQFFDGRYRSASADAKNSEAQSTILAQFEPTMAETSTDGMIPKLDEFWASWQSLSTDPTNNSLRANLLDNASALTNAFTTRTAEISQLRNDQNLAVSDQVEQINTLASQVASLNGEISHVLSVGEQPNDLLDKRDQALDTLANLTGSVSFDQKNGEVSVSIGGHVLVVGHDTFKLHTQTSATDLNMQDVYWEENQKLVPTSGELKGILEVRDNFLPDQQAGLNSLAATIIKQVNDIHATGYGPTTVTGTPNDFFTGTDASTIAVNNALVLDPGKIATADTAGAAGNNAIAVKIAGLKLQKVMGNLTMNDFYNGQITNRSLVTQRAANNTTQQNLVVKALSDQRESVAGVSLDEEAAHMAQTQKAYQASARMLTAYDELLDTVINRMGLVGR